MRINLGAVGHFSLAVKDPEASAAWWSKSFDLDEIFRFDDGVAISNDVITIALFRGRPGPSALEHLSFHLASMDELEAAVRQLTANGVAMEDPGNEIGPEGPGSPHLGVWFHDLDGYRWELSVQNGAAEKR